MPLPKSRTKMINLFKQIKNESLRVIISEVIGIENENRSSHHFPIKKIENIVDDEAILIEQKTGKGVQNEIRKTGH
jgi:hypothetical protein